MIHTQWWNQENGDTRQAPIPPNTMAHPISLRRTANQMARMTSANTIITATNHHCGMWRTRSMTERSDWAPGLAWIPTLEESLMAQVQKRVASGTNNQPISTVSRKVPMVVATARQRRSMMKMIMKNAGVSFSPAASPTPTPAHRFRFFGRKSRATRNMRMRLICP